jgi:UDP-N-acetyl-D-glucosamine dehydrogenase
MSAEALRKKIADRTARVGLIGLGYAGLPIAAQFALAGYPVLGFDTDSRKTEILNRGESPIDSVPSETMATLVKEGRFEATDDFTNLRQVDVITICVPTPLTKNREPDMRYIRTTTGIIADHLQTGQLVILQSTTYPGTTDEVVLPILRKGGRECGRDFFLAFSPEREDPGNRSFDTKRIPKVVGGVDRISGELATDLLAGVIDRVIPVSSARAAEATKILENIYRAVNIALVNELKVLFDKMGINVWEVIEAASSKPFGYHPFYPGPGLGGHCIPIDPFYLTWKAREYETPTRFIELAGEVNSAMPHYVLQKTMDALNDRGIAVKGAKVLILGAAYKADVDDPRESPAIKLMELFQDRGADVSYHDPHIPKIPPMRHYRVSLTSVPLTEETLQESDIAVIVTAHSAFDFEWIVRHAPQVVDTRNATRSIEDRSKIVMA